MTKPRIGIVSHFPPPPGGIPILAELFVTRLRAEGHTVVPIRANLSGGPILARIDGTRFLRTFVRFPVFLWRLLRALPQVDVIHTLSHCGLAFFLFTTPAVVLGRLFGKRVVLNYHGGRAEPFMRRFPRSTGWVLRRAHSIVVPSGFLADVFARMGHRTTIVPNPCELEDLLDQALRTPMRPAFIVARNLEPVYNIACALRAFQKIRARHPSATMVVAGSGTEEARLHRLAADLGIADAVAFTGYLPNARLRELYASASCFLNTSNADNMPVSIIEAFAGGLPVVTTRAGGIPYFVEQGVTGLLADLDDDQAIADQACRLLAEPGLASRIAANARAAAASFQWRHVYPLFDREYAGGAAA